MFSQCNDRGPKACALGETNSDQALFGSDFRMDAEGGWRLDGGGAGAMDDGSCSDHDSLEDRFAMVAVSDAEGGWRLDGGGACPSFALFPLVFNSDTLLMNTSLGILSPLALIPPPRPPSRLTITSRQTRLRFS
jgi:hypothetical protein